MKREFEIRYAYESNAPEGNSMALEETRAVPRVMAEKRHSLLCGVT